MEDLATLVVPVSSDEPGFSLFVFIGSSNEPADAGLGSPFSMIPFSLVFYSYSPSCSSLFPSSFSIFSVFLIFGHLPLNASVQS